MDSDNNTESRTCYFPAPRSRLDRYAGIIDSGTCYFPAPISRLDRYRKILESGTCYFPAPISRLDRYAGIIDSGTCYFPAPKSKLDMKNKLKEVSEKVGLGGLLGLKTKLGVSAEDFLQILADVQEITPPLTRIIDHLWSIEFGTVYHPEPQKPELPIESTLYDAIFNLAGKKETYKISNIKDILNILIEDINYDGALHRVTPEIKYILNVFFKGHLSMEEGRGISSGTTSEVPEFRKFELEILEDKEHQYIFIYGRGTLINSIGDLPVEKIIAVLRKEGKWEA